ncbi:hypothetical protein [Chitinibacter tainanensis]|uniref:hypothetical protein n=1 Tax=Chitinibacter tainanensis TaxID=230667 RepID=UPI002354D995|nr:hypothetical protein [Chitinibacter tainanensis]
MSVARTILLSARLLLAPLLLAACGTTPVTPVSPPKPAATPAPQVQGMIISGRSSKAIMEDIIRFRQSKGMQLKVRTANELEFSAKVPKANIPTEARMRYTLTQTQQGWLLAARVYQISYPSTKNEKVEEITAHVQDKLNEEFARYTGK